MSDATERIDTIAPRSMGLLIEAVRQLSPDDWARPSNLDGWSVRDLVGHVTGSAAKVVTLVEGGELWGRSEPADWISDDPAGRLDELAARLRAALPTADLAAPRPSPQGEVPARRALGFPVADLALHSWDLYRSRGVLMELPDDVLAFCRELSRSLPEDLMRNSGAFGPAQPAPPDASPTAALMAWLGRSVDLAG